ncbi:MAG: hypothetical protein ACM3YN_03190 [Parcubacteria group bacterium]
MGHSAAQSGRESVTATVLREILQPLGLTEARDVDLGLARRLAAGLISPDIASEPALRALHGKTGYGVYLVHEEGWLRGILALVMLNEAGHAAVRAGTFDALNPALEHAVAAHEEPVAIYGWGILGATRSAAATVVEACRAIIANVPFPVYARAATPAGLRMLTAKLDFTPYPDSPDGLLWLPERKSQRRAA